MVRNRTTRKFERPMDLITDTRFRDTSLAQLAGKCAVEKPEHTAVFFDSGLRLSYLEAWLQASSLAVAIKSTGIKQGSTLSFQLPNIPESVIVAIAASITGLVINPIVPIYRGKELTFILSDAQTEILFIPHRIRGFDYVEMINELRPSLPSLKSIICCGKQDDLPNGILSYEEFTGPHQKAECPIAKIDPNETKILLYTSGTTGNPKAVMHSHNSLAKALDNGVEAWNLQIDDLMLMPSPVTHITGYVNGIELPFYTATKALLMETWNVEEAINLIDRYGATTCVSATPFLRELISTCKKLGLRLPGFRLFACGGASVPSALIYEAQKALLDCHAVRVYGSTEAPLVTVGFVGPEQTELAAETDGKVYNYEVIICDEEGRDLGLQKEGEIWVRGPAMMLGYRNPAQDTQIFTSDGFFKTGDIGKLLPSQAIVITDRKKDIIIRGGENISAREVEEIILTHPGVLEAAAVSVTHRRLGETVAMFLTLTEGATISLEDLTNLCLQSKLAKQKWPQWLKVINKMPKTASGKIQKSLLREKLKTKNVILD